MNCRDARCLTSTTKARPALTLYEPLTKPHMSQACAEDQQQRCTSFAQKCAVSSTSDDEVIFDEIRGEEWSRCEGIDVRAPCACV